MKGIKPTYKLLVLNHSTNNYNKYVNNYYDESRGNPNYEF